VFINKGKSLQSVVGDAKEEKKIVKKRESLNAFLHISNHDSQAGLKYNLLHKFTLGDAFQWFLSQVAGPYS
jgi:cell division protein YceG involved in septum cleavage